MQKYFVLGLMASILTVNVFAGTVGPMATSPTWAWVGTLSAGPIWEHASKTQTFFLTPAIEKTYDALRSTPMA